ncbi:MAG TPA: hypothetical protein VIB00_03985, partial [Pyrinomonadaceae bacterium]
MAESPESTESLVKREADKPAHDPIVSRSTSGIMLLCALLMTGSLIWALYDEAIGQRPWKGIQQEFVARYTRYLNSIKGNAGRTEEEVKASAEYQTLAEEAKAAEEKVRPEVGEIDQRVRTIQGQLNAVTDPFQNQRGRLTVINYNIEVAEGSAKDKYRREAESKKQELIEVELPANGSGDPVVQKLNYGQLEK